MLSCSFCPIFTLRPACGVYVFARSSFLIPLSHSPKPYRFDLREALPIHDNLVHHDGIAHLVKKRMRCTWYAPAGFWSIHLKPQVCKHYTCAENIKLPNQLLLEKAAIDEIAVDMVGKTVMTRNLDCEYMVFPFRQTKLSYASLFASDLDTPRMASGITRAVTQGLPPFLCVDSPRNSLGRALLS